MAQGDNQGQGFDLLRLFGFSNATKTSQPNSALRARGTLSGGGSGRSAAEAYYGRSLSDKEYDALIRATHAESSSKNSPEEQAMIMGSILNRARANPNGVMGALNAPNQFQSVTGTRFKPGPSPNYVNGPSPAREASIESAARDLLPRVPTNQTDFTAASRSAYGAGTNPGYLAQLEKTGGAVYGGTQFASALGSTAAPASSPAGNIFASLFNPSGLFGQTDISRGGRSG